MSVAVGVTTAIMTPVRAIFDTGAGPNLIRRDQLPDDWESYRVFGTQNPPIVGAGGRRLAQKGTVTLVVEIGDLRVRGRFIVVDGLAAPCILGCQFINRHIANILPKEKRIHLSNGTVVSILKGSDPLTPTSEKTAEKEAENRPSNTVRVAKTVTIPARAESHIWVNCQSPGLQFLQAKHSPSLGLSIANGVADVVPLKPFLVRVLNTSLQPRVLPKNMVVGHAFPNPQGIINLVTLEDSPTPVTPDIDGDTWRDEVDLSHLPASVRDAVYELLRSHRHMWDGHLGEVRATEHRIDLVPGAKPVHAQPYRAGPKAREAEQEEVLRMLKAGVIEPASTDWASPVVLVPKPDGSLRFCVDYRKLNALTIGDSYPLPRMDECIDSLGDATIFSTLDCNSGYWQIPVRDEDKDKTTFTCHEGTFRFTRMPFGLKNAPATFQRGADVILSGLRWKSCLVYLDDIIIFSRTIEDHFKHLGEVLHLLSRAGLSLKLKKCHFFKETVNYLGHVIRPGKLEVASKNTEALKTAQPPSTQSELRSFLGLCNVYRRFVPGFAKVAAPLNALLRKGTPPKLDPLTGDQLQAFETLRDKLLHPPVLALPRATGRYILDTDASAEQVGCCLLQKHPDGTRHPIGYWSHSLNSAERNYSTTEKECLAIVWAVQQLRPYLEGQKFLIRTDHHALRWVLNLADAQGRLARWRLRLSEFDFEVEYSPGREHHAADFMSRRGSPLCSVSSPVSEEPSVDSDIPCFLVDEPVPILPISVEQVRELQQEDPGYPSLANALTKGCSLDFDPNGNVGVVLPNGEFQLSLPPALTTTGPIAIVESQPFPPSNPVRGDAHHLRKGEIQGNGEYFSPPSPEITPSNESQAPRSLLFGHLTRLGRHICELVQSPQPAERVEPLRSPGESKQQPEVSTDPVYLAEVRPAAIQTEELMREQATDPDCQRYSTYAGPDSLFDFNEDGILVRKAPLDGSRQVVVPASLQPRVLHLEHFPKTAGHPGITRMFRTLRKTFFWPKMAVDVATTVRECTVCAKNRMKERTRTNYLKLFPASGPLEDVSMDLLGPLPKTQHGNRFLLVITDRFSKLTRTVPLRSTSAYAVSRAFCDHWAFVYGPPRIVLTDNGPQFAAKFFLAVCRELGIDKVFSSAYHPQTNGQVERFNRTIVNSLRGYVQDRQEDWDEFTGALTFAYNCRVHSSLKLAPFELVLSRPPPSLTLNRPEFSQDQPATSVKLEFLTKLRQLLPEARRELAAAQARYKRGYDSHVRLKNQSIEDGSFVYIRREVHDPGLNPKLDSPVDGPFEVVSNYGNTFLLRIADQLVRVSSDRVTPAPRLNTGEMTPAAVPSDEDQAEPPASGPEDPVAAPAKADEPSPDEEFEPDGGLANNRTADPTGEDEPEYVMEKIVGMKQIPTGGHLYKVRWYGYAPADDTWEPLEHLPPNVVRRYHKRIGLPSPYPRSKPRRGSASH